ncbi:MAG: hypothetical protein OXN93_08255 [bacterium]|nr:hypothetical protein [bacterium]
MIKSVITDQDTPGYTVDPVVITKVEELASQTHHGAAHVNRWQRVLVAFGVLHAAGVQGGAITVAEAQENANRYSSPGVEPGRHRTHQPPGLPVTPTFRLRSGRFAPL